MLINSSMLAGILTTYNNTILAPTNGIYVCVGSMPTDAEVDAMTAVTAAQIANNKALTFTGHSIAQMQAKDTSVPILVYSTKTAESVNSTKTGTLGWAVLHGRAGFAIVEKKLKLGTVADPILPSLYKREERRLVK
jgi:hypothetical protein